MKKKKKTGTFKDALKIMDTEQIQQIFNLCFLELRKRGALEDGEIDEAEFLKDNFPSYHTKIYHNK
jgi:hypothetical protein